MHPEDQQEDNYTYDEIGNLSKDLAEDIERIEWTVSGKVYAVIRKANSGKANLYFSYDAMGNRISKKSVDALGNTKTTYYFRDASGNEMAIYQKTNSSPFDIKEFDIYGSSRLGNYQPQFTTRNYEFSDHLGNVHLVLNDQKEVQSATEYFNFGMVMQSIGSSRFGFNSMERDDEYCSCNGGSYTSEFRQYDSRIGRWKSTDPYASMPNQISWSPYKAFFDNPIVYTDKTGGCENCDSKTVNSEYKNETADGKFVFKNKEGNIVETVVLKEGKYVNDPDFGSGQVGNVHVKDMTSFGWTYVDGTGTYGDVDRWQRSFSQQAGKLADGAVEILEASDRWAEDPATGQQVYGVIGMVNPVLPIIESLNTSSTGQNITGTSNMSGKEAAFNAGLSVFGEIKAIGTVGKAGVKLLSATSKFSTLSKAADYGFDSYNNLRKLTGGTGLQVHHLIEQRFAGAFGQVAGNMKSIVLTVTEHQVFTNAWRNQIGYNGSSALIRTATATKEQIEAAAKVIYKDYPEILQALGL